MKFALLILFAAGALSAPRYGFSNWEEMIFSKDVPECGDLRRLSPSASTIYDYEGETRNTIKGSTPDDTGLLIKARIYIHPKGSCKFALQINEVELKVKSKTQKRFTTASESKKFRRELAAQELTFKIHNGMIVKLFPSAAEPTHVLNIKRGILSTLQLGKLATTEEVDVNGRCKVTIIEKGGKILKRKDLSECKERALNEVGFQTTSFQNNDLPIKPLTSTSVCSYQLRKNKISHVDCIEEHMFRPFSAGHKSPSGAMTIVRQKLKFVGEKSGYMKEQTKKASEIAGVSLVFQHVNEETKPDKSIVERIDVIMKNLVGSIKSESLAAKQSSANHFTRLVDLVRKLDKKRMIPVWDKYFDCQRSRICNSRESDMKNVYRQYLLDALTYCGTSTCVYTVHNVIVEGEVIGREMNTFLQGIALVAKPTKAMIRDVLNIARKKPSRQSHLTLGTLVYRYCTANAAACVYDKTNPITHAELFLEDKLGKGCSGQENNKRVEEILMALKAVGNAGRPVRAWQTLLTCARTSLHQNVSAAALEALRRMPCNQEIQNSLHRIHENVDIDPERRIDVYLALMRCPTEKTLRRVVAQLEREKSRQVGSFMASHLKNINESTDPRHKAKQEILATVLTAKALIHLNWDVTKYSRAFEGSVYSGLLKSGASLESHLIFSPNSYIPRSALLNLTATILDVPVNILEMAIRVEGTETLIENLVGPGGYFPDLQVLKMFNMTFTNDDIRKLRTRRAPEEESVEDENVANLQKKVKRQHVLPSGNVNVKLLGHEVCLFSYEDIFWGMDQIDNMNVIDLLLKFAKGGHKTFTKSMMFLELTHTVPTGLGLPLKLKLTGSTVASLELDGKFDIRNMFWGPSSMEIKGYIRPSAVVELAGQMGVHSHYVDSGVFVNTSMFTSQMLKGGIVYKQGHTLQINLDAPEKPVELFKVASTPFLFLNEEVDIIKGAPRRITPDFCVNATMILGVGLCTRLSVPIAFREYESPYFPLSGPSSFEINLIKSDVRLTTYQFSVNLRKMTTGNVGWFEVGTPGATYNRRLAGIVKYVETHSSRTLTVGSFEGGVINGELVRNKIELMVRYHNNNNRFEVDLRSNLLTNKLMKMKFMYFNDTHFLGRQMGVLMSAEYDWYKLQHLLKFVDKSTSYLLHSKTTYWPEKHLTSEIEIVPATKSIAMRFDANHVKQSVEMLGKYINTETEKGMKFTATHLSTMAKTSFYVGILNEESTKKFIINGTALRKKVELTWGYYVRGIVRELRFDANVAGKTMALFADYNKIQSSRLGATLGAIIGKHKVGISSDYLRRNNAFDRELCTFIFYNDKIPMKTCLALKKVPASWITPEHKRLSLMTRVLGRTANIDFDYKNKDGKYDFTTTAMYGNKVLFKNNLELLYKTIWDIELKMLMEIGKETISSRLFSTMLTDNICTFGIEARGFKQMVKLMATYSRNVKENTAVHGIIFEGWVNKKLPMDFRVILELGKTINGLSTILNIKSYQMKHSLLWINPEGGKYSVVLDFIISQGNFIVFRNKITQLLVWNGVEKAYKLTWEFIIWNKKFEYGWDVTYQNRSTLSKMAHALNFGLNYGRNRRSSMTTTLANSEKHIEFLIDIEYLPNRQISHVIRFNKETRQLDIILEFLPRMFVKLMGRLDKTEGWKLSTDLTFNWVNYNRVLRWMAAYTDRTDIKGLRFQFSAYGKQFYTDFEFNDQSKTGVLTMSALGRSLKFVGHFVKNRGLAGIRILTEKKEGDMIIPSQLIECLVTFNSNQVSLELKTPSKNLVKIVGKHNRIRKMSSIEVFGLGRSLLKLFGQYKGHEKTVMFQTFILDKERFQVVGKYSQEGNTVFLSLDTLRKNMNIMFSAKWDPERKQISFSTEVFRRVFGVVARLDTRKYVSSFYVFYQKNLVGASVYLDNRNKALVYNVTLTPRLSGQVTIEIVQDRIIKVVLQRKIGMKIVNESVLRYELANEISKLAFQWNKDTVKQLKGLIAPIIEIGIKDITRIAHNLRLFIQNAELFTRKLSIELIRNTTARILKMINDADRLFDKFDFVAARDKVGHGAVIALKKIAKLKSTCLQRISHYLTVTHKNLPVIMERIRKITREMVKQMRIATFKMTKYAKITYKIAKNLTESGIPVVKTVIKLAKGFRIRGRTTEQIAKQLIHMVKKISNTWRKNLSVQLKEMRKNIAEYVKEIRVPYSTKRIGELYNNLVAELVKITKNYDLEKSLKTLVKMILHHEIKGHSINKYMDALWQKINIHMDTLKQKIGELPEAIKVTAVELIGKLRLHIKSIGKSIHNFINEIKHFSLPFRKHLREIHVSVNKHFSPLTRKAVKKMQVFITAEFKKIHEPMNVKVAELIIIIEKFFMPLLTPLRPLYNDLCRQIRGIRFLEHEIGSVIDSYSNELKVRAKMILKQLNVAYINMINKANTILTLVMKMTPEKAVEAFVDHIVVLGKRIIGYWKTIYASRMQLIKKMKIQIDKGIKLVKEVLAAMTSKPVADLVHIAFTKAGELVIDSLKQTIRLIDQIAMVDILGPLKTFWKDLDLLAHFHKYGLNRKIMNAIHAAKAVNLTQTIFKTIQRHRKLVTGVIGQTEKKMAEIFGRIRRVYRYLISIPKKDFEVFYTEMKSNLLENKINIYSFMSKMYSLIMKRLQKTTEHMKDKYQEYYDTYSFPANDWYNDIKDASSMVYYDTKDDSINVHNYYKDIIKGIFKEKYSKLLTKARSEFSKLLTKIEKKYNDLHRKALDIYNNNADMTWEEICIKISKYGQTKREIALKYSRAKLEKVRVIANNIMKVTKKLHKHLTILTRKAIAYVDSTIGRHVLEMYTKTVKHADKTARSLHKKLSEIFQKNKALVLDWYMENNEKSLRRLYLDIKETLMVFYRKNMEKATEIFEQNYSRMLIKVTTMKNAMKVKLATIKNKILPILKNEAESMTNQTLRAVIILANKTAKAYSPHYTIVKDHAIIYYNKGKHYVIKLHALSKVQSVKLYARTIKEMKLQTKNLVKHLKEILGKIKGHPSYKKVINHELVGKATKWLRVVSEKLEQKVTQVRQIIEDLRNHPRVTEFREKLQEKINQYKKLFNEYKHHPKVEQFIAVLKQINKSGIYTIIKLKGKMIPRLSRLQLSLMKIPELVAWKINFLHQYPEECFWTTLRNLTTVLNTLKSYEWTNIHKKAWTEAHHLIKEITDDKTKVAAMNVVDMLKKYYKKVIALAKHYYNMVRSLPRRLEGKFFAYLNKVWNWLGKQWKRFPLYPVANHEIWRELAGEIKNHEIVSELKILAVEGKKLSIEYKEKLLKFVKHKNAELKEKVTELKENLVKFVQKLENQFNSLIDKTTIKLVVMRIKELKTLIKNKKNVLVQKMKKTLQIANIYYTKVYAIGDEYLAKAKITWNRIYPKQLIKNAILKWKVIATKAKAFNKKYTKLGNEMKEKYTKIVFRLWSDSKLKQQLLTLMKMTVRKTTEEIIKLPAKIKTLTKTLYKNALARIKIRYDKYLLPYVRIAETCSMMVFNEINEIAVFIYRYYRLKDNFYNTKEYLNTIRSRTEKEIKRIAPKIPVIAKVYLEKVPVIATKYLEKVVRSSLKAMHMSMVYVDNVDIRHYLSNMKIRVMRMRALIPDFQKYVIIDITKGELVLSIPHYRPIEASFTHHINRVIDQIENLIREIRIVSSHVVNKAIVVTRLMLETIKAKTIELRKDIKASILIHKKIGLHLINRIKIAVIDAYKTAIAVSQKIYNRVLRTSDRVIKIVNKTTQKVYSMIENAVVDICNSKSFKVAFEKAKVHIKIFADQAKEIILPYIRAAELFAKNVYSDITCQYMKLLHKTKPYAMIAKSAIKNWRNGADVRTALRVIELQLNRIYRSLKTDHRSKMVELENIIKESIDEDIWILAGEYLRTHRAIFGKYGRRVYKFTKYRIDRAIRITKTMVRKHWRRPIEAVNPYRSIAMIFGKSHVMTFDKKYYEFPPYNKPHCTYVLARDFQNGQFTILSQKEHLIVITPHMRVKIHMHGKVESVIKAVKSGRVRKEEIDGLPVQSETGFCNREEANINCEFMQGLRITCDTEHFLCTVELSGWHYAKSQGLLGTNNHEIYDEMRLPSGRITESITEFANAWEVTGSRECQLRKSNPIPVCYKAPSQKCFELLKKKTSLYSLLFGIVDPMPYLKACQIDSADCKSDKPIETSHCNAVSAYVHMLRLKGIWVPFSKDCTQYRNELGKSYKVGAKWIQPSTRAVDVVIMISERRKIRSMRSSMASLIVHMYRELLSKGYNTRFALIGFGGHNKYEIAHVHTSNGNIFTDGPTVATKIKSMPYTGTAKNINDGLDAMVLASTFAFRPGAGRIFCMFNTATHRPSWYGPTLDETIMSVKYESNATLFVFDNFHFKHIGKRVIGQTEKNAYLYPNEVVSLVSSELPLSPFTQIIKSTHGGMFTNKLKPSYMKILETAITESIVTVLKTHRQKCESCILRIGNVGQGIPMCRSISRTQC